MNTVHGLTVQGDASAFPVRLVPKANLGNANGRAIQDPGFIGPGVEDGCLPHNALQHPSVAAFPYRIGRDEPGSLCPGFGQGLGRLGKPITDEVGAARNPLPVQRTQGIHIAVAQSVSHEFVPQERRIAHNRIGFGPRALASIRVHERIPALDGVQGFQDGIAGDGEPVVAHPLDFPDPHGDTGQFGGIGVDLNALDVRGTHKPQPRRQTQRLRLQLNEVFQVLEGHGGPDRGSCPNRTPDPGP